jgi:hypothetical protein
VNRTILGQKNGLQAQFSQVSRIDVTKRQTKSLYFLSLALIALGLGYNEVAAEGMFCDCGIILSFLICRTFFFCFERHDD